jgi:hypothetical protein
MAGQQTLNLYVEVRLLCPQPRKKRPSYMDGLFVCKCNMFRDNMNSLFESYPSYGKWRVTLSIGFFGTNLNLGVGVLDGINCKFGILGMDSFHPMALI